MYSLPDKVREALQTLYSMIAPDLNTSVPEEIAADHLCTDLMVVHGFREEYELLQTEMRRHGDTFIHLCVVNEILS